MGTHIFLLEGRLVPVTRVLVVAGDLMVTGKVPFCISVPVRVKTLLEGRVVHGASGTPLSKSFRTVIVRTPDSRGLKPDTSQ
jgi:hypothetical protein